MASILYIDDERLTTITTEDYLRDCGHDVVTAHDPCEGLKLFAKRRPDLVVSEFQLACGSNESMLRKIREKSPGTPVVIVSQASNIQDVKHTMNSATWDFVGKPLLNMEILSLSLENALERARLARENTLQRHELARRNQKLVTSAVEHEKALGEIIERLETALGNTIKSLATAVRQKDPYTAGHSESVAFIADLLARDMQMDQKRRDVLSAASLLHDIGKIGVSGKILNKIGPLTAEERTVIQKHVENGYRILSDIPFEGNVAEIVRQHHECFDGSGYPRQLAGEDILLEARILAVADVYDAMTSDRPYRRRLRPVDALGHIKRDMHAHFCPQCVQSLVRIHKQGLLREAP